jgi:hypothetical protein
MSIITDTDITTEVDSKEEIATCEIDKLYPLAGVCPEPGNCPLILSSEGTPSLEYHLCLPHVLHCFKDAAITTMEKGKEVFVNDTKIWPPDPPRRRWFH